MSDAVSLVQNMAREARVASAALAQASADQKTRALQAAAQQLRLRSKDIMAANAEDMAAAQAAGLTPALLDRLHLNEKRIANIAESVAMIADLPDPVGAEMAHWTRPNGLEITRVRVPLGVIGVIYESRPNVTADAGALAFKAGNTVLLRGGSEARHSNQMIHACMSEGLRAAYLPPAAIQLVPTQDRAAVGAMLAAHGLIDVIVPRGGKSLVARVQAEARVPVFAHLDGICHTYVDVAAQEEKARAIVLNAKMRRTGVCGATETLLLDQALQEDFKRALLCDLLDAGCEVRASADLLALDNRLMSAADSDWDTEYLDAIISVKNVAGVADAIRHINAHGSHHTDAIITENSQVAELFLREIDSAIVLHNASTQFADGGEFGFGAEIGISTGRLHARGPIGVEQLTTFKYILRGNGQTRVG